VRVKNVSDFSPFVLSDEEPGGGPTAVTLRSLIARAAGKDLTGFRNLSGLVALGVVGTLLWVRRRRVRL
jgi:hypothetical protein